MARFRNPRYAPESLERRLSPSDLLTTTTVADVYVAPTDPLPPPPVMPPLILVPPPTDPVMPG